MYFKLKFMTIIWSLLIFVLTILPGNYFPHVPAFLDLFSPDKIVHLTIFGLLSFFALNDLDKQYWNNFVRYNKTKIALIYTVFIGGITEIIQGLMNWGRQASIYDFIANCLGAILGIYLYKKLFKIYKKQNS